MKYAGIPSFCTASDLVIEACLEQAVRFDDYVLVEATANQVNQFGGYTGMKPADYRDFVYEIADRVGFPREKIILGGDHLGPLTWQNEPEKDAMEKSIELVKLFVLAGFKKIHLDTIENTVCRHARRAMYFNGLPEKPIKNIHLKNIQVSAEVNSDFFNCENVTKENINLTIEK